MRLSWWGRPRDLVADSLVEWEQIRAEGRQKFGTSGDDLFAQATMTSMMVNAGFSPGGIVSATGGWCAPTEIRYDTFPTPTKPVLEWI